jgi:hypothetical protein
VKKLAPMEGAGAPWRICDRLAGDDDVSTRLLYGCDDDGRLLLDEGGSDG